MTPRENCTTCGGDGWILARDEDAEDGYSKIDCPECEEVNDTNQAIEKQ